MVIAKQVFVLNYISSIISPVIFLYDNKEQQSCQYTSTISCGFTNTAPRLVLDFIKGDILCMFSKDNPEKLVINISNTNDWIFKCDLIECNFKDMKETCIKLEAKINKLLMESNFKIEEKDM